MLLVTEFTNERGEAFTVLQLIKRLRSAIIQIDGILFEHQGRIEELEIDVEEIKGNIEDIKEQLLNIINRVDVLENKVDIVEDTLVTIESNISNIETILNSHGEDISSLNSVVANMTSELSELQNIVSNIPIVQPSLLNGYIKIDGVDVPVFVGGAGGAGGGGGEIIASYNDYIDTTVNSPTEKKNLILSFDVPDYNKNIELSGMMAGQCNSQYPRGTINFYGYDEDNIEVLLLTLDTNGTNSVPYYRWQYIINLFGDGGGISFGVTNNGSFENTNNNNNYDGPTLSRKNIDSNKIKRVDIYLEYNALDIGTFKLYPFNILISKYSDDGDGGNGGNGGSVDTVQTFKTLGVSLDNEDNGIRKNIFKMPTSESYLSKYKHFKGRLQITSSGARNITLKVNNQDFELYPVRSDVYCIIDYTVEVERLGLVTELIVSWYNGWYNGTTRELITTESKYYYPVEIADNLTMDITADISTYGFLNVHKGELTVYPYMGDLEQEE